MPEISRRPRALMATASADAPLKGLRYLLRAYASLLDKYPDLELLLVSKPQPGGKTERLVKYLGIEDRVKFVSGISTEQMVRYYAEATIAVVPSVYEGFGLPAGEAMACGVPVVSTDGGALPEVVGDAGVIVPAKSVEALASAIAELLEDPAQRAELGAKGRARILEQFCWQVCAGQMTDYYQQVLTNANG
jgi:glycosyltransferase involved in cell wall biosynthesis